MPRVEYQLQELEVFRDVAEILKSLPEIWPFFLCAVRSLKDDSSSVFMSGCLTTAMPARGKTLTLIIGMALILVGVISISFPDLCRSLKTNDERRWKALGSLMGGSYTGRGNRAFKLHFLRDIRCFLVACF